MNNKKNILKKSKEMFKDGLDEVRLSKNIGQKFKISKNLLGKGSYGNVYLATDENGNNLAVKKCNIDAEVGIPNILEASIMSSIIHPYLNKALRIEVTPSILYLIQDLAISDLAKHTRREKGNYRPNLEELRKWCFDLCQAVFALHKENIIHGDIKAANILLYEDNSIKLTDFTLSVKKWENDKKFNHNVCTCTHRPIESILEQFWDESLDIWSLGCTFYEIAYGELLFPYQRDRQLKTQRSKILVKNCFINSIIDWKEIQKTSPEILKGIEKFPIKYTPITLCEEYKNPEYQEFNTLLSKILTIDPNSRPSILEILNDPFFTGLKLNTLYLHIRRPLKKISVSEHARVMRYITCYTNNKLIQKLSLNIYCQCYDLKHLTEHLKAVGCTWIASKLILGDDNRPKIGLPLNQIFSVERDICHNLFFRLHDL
jgi:serine/threonine protein kinase